MQLSRIKPILFLVMAAFLAGVSSESRNKRQIIFEEDDDNRVNSADCRTPDSQPGRCIRLTACTALRMAANPYQLRRYFCGFEGEEPKVCCPRGRVAVVQPPTPSRRTMPVTRRTPPVTRWTSPTTRRTTAVTRRTTPSTRRITPSTRRVTRTTPTTRRIVPTTRRTTPSRVTSDSRGMGGSSGALVKPSFLPKRCGVTDLTNTRVVGGREAINGSWPWMAVVMIEKRNGAKSPDCGGALVTNRHVITAAHCVVTGRGANTMDPRQVSVLLGTHDLRRRNEDGAIEVPVQTIRRHEQFDPRSYRNDIAVLKMARPVQFNSRIAPICLPYDSLRGKNLTKNTAFVIGFGSMSFNGPSSDVLMEAGFDIQDQEYCKKAYEKEVNITSVYLCAGTTDGSKDSCQGDSGGPLSTIGKNGSFYLVGVVSFGKLCAQPGYPGVYTRVTEFLDWLAKNLAD